MLNHEKERRKCLEQSGEPQLLRPLKGSSRQGLPRENSPTNLLWHGYPMKWVTEVKLKKI